MDRSLMLANLAALVLVAMAASKSTDELINDLMLRMKKDMTDLKDLKENIAIKDHKGDAMNKTTVKGGKVAETVTKPKEKEHESLFNINAREEKDWMMNPGMILEGGDILVTAEQKKIEEADNDPNIQKDALRSPARRWPKTNGRVRIPIVMDGMDNQKLAAIRLAAQKFSEGTCIDFVMTTQTNEHYIRFINGGGCYSYLGRVTNGPDNGFQPISIGNGCGFLGIVEHEMMHALGFYHEQARPDRDQFVKLQLQNLANPQFASQFAKQQAAAVDTANEQYDFQSIMHYDSTAFAQRGKLTIVKLNNEPINSNRNGFSPSDLRGLNKIYECQNNPAPTDGPDIPDTGEPDGEPTVNCKAFAAIGLCGYSEICDLCKNDCNAAPTNTIITNRNTRCGDYATRGFCTSTNPRFKSYMDRNCQKACMENKFAPDGCNKK